VVGETDDDTVLLDDRAVEANNDPEDTEHGRENGRDQELWPPGGDFQRVRPVWE
jgi:hypothetical protein